MRKVVVTGATSMIAVALIEELIKDKNIEKIYAVVRSNTEKWVRVPKDSRIKRIDCEIDDYGQLASSINEKCDCFYHMAWARTSTYEENAKDIIDKCNGIRGVILAVEVAKQLGCKKFIWAGSQSEYGLIEGKIGPNHPCNPVRADGVAHYAAGLMGRILSEQYHISFIWMRVFSVYGKYDRTNSMISSTIRKMKNNERCLFSPAEQLWDYLYSEDIGKAFYLVGEKVKESKIYCVGSGEEHPLKEYIEIMRDIINPSVELGIGELPYPNNPIMRLCADNSSLMEDTGWRPKVSFREGIERLVELYDKLS